MRDKEVLVGNPSVVAEHNPFLVVECSPPVGSCSLEILKGEEVAWNSFGLGSVGEEAVLVVEMERAALRWVDVELGVDVQYGKGKQV